MNHSPTVDLTCPDCKSRLVLRNSRYGQFWGCAGFPRCSVRVGCHKGTNRPLGTPADAATRAARIAAHAEFDKLWQYPTRQMSRKLAYGWLRDVMDLTVETGHIAMMDVGQCERLIEEVRVALELGDAPPIDVGDVNV